MKRPTSPRQLSMAAPRHGERGFTLLETLVAFVVLAIGLGALLSGIALAIRSDARTQSSMAALLLAQSRLEAVGISEPLATGQREGNVGPKYRWHQAIDEIRLPLEPANASAGQPRQSPAGLRTFWVSVVVEAADGTTTKLAALKIAPRATP